MELFIVLFCMFYLLFSSAKKSNEGAKGRNRRARIEDLKKKYEPDNMTRREAWEMLEKNRYQIGQYLGFKIDCYASKSDIVSLILAKQGYFDIVWGVNIGREYKNEEHRNVEIERARNIERLMHEAGKTDFYLVYVANSYNGIDDPLCGGKMIEKEYYDATGRSDPYKRLW